MATPQELEAYRQGYHAGLRTAAEPERQPPGRRQYVLAVGTFVVGLGGVAALVAARTKSEHAETFAAFAVAAALGSAAITSVRVLLGEPTPTFRLK
jgi:hypothetical protein